MQAGNLTRSALRSSYHKPGSPGDSNDPRPCMATNLGVPNGLAPCRLQDPRQKGGILGTDLATQERMGNRCPEGTYYGLLAGALKGSVSAAL